MTTYLHFHGSYLAILFTHINLRGSWVANYKGQAIAK